ncbi:MAG: transporter [Notoacmeibacter sp.]|nr:transporter [Notoacmeibacter sp.]
MPSHEEIQRYVAGVWQMMITARPDGLRLLDISADGFWRSFWALALALPPMSIAWVAAAPAYVTADTGKLSVVLRLGLIDLAVWLVPLVALAILARPIGMADRFVHFVISGNWGGAVIAWLLAPVSILLLFLPEGEGGGLLSLAAFVASLTLGWRLAHGAIARDWLYTTAVFTGVIVLSLFILFALQAALGLVLQS